MLSDFEFGVSSIICFRKNPLFSKAGITIDGKMEFCMICAGGESPPPILIQVREGIHSSSISQTDFSSRLEKLVVGFKREREKKK